MKRAGRLTLNASICPFHTSNKKGPFISERSFFIDYGKVSVFQMFAIASVLSLLVFLDRVAQCKIYIAYCYNLLKNLCFI